MEDLLNGLLQEEVEQFVEAGTYERTGNRRGHRSGSCERQYQTRVGDVNIKTPQTKLIPFSSGVIELYRRREVIGISEGCKEDKAGWRRFLQDLKRRGLGKVTLVVSDACLGLKEALAEVFPDAEWQRCIVHFYPRS